MKDSSLCC